MEDKFWEEEIERLSRKGSDLASVLAEIQAGRFPFRLSGLEGSAAAFFLQQVWSRMGRPLVVVLSTADEARRLFRDLLFFSDRGAEENPYFSSRPLLYFP